MIKKTVLIIAPYPIAKPVHGGQKRAKAIFEFYKSNFLDAKYVGVFHRGQYPDWGEDDLLIGQPDIIARIDDNPYASELVSGEAIDKDIHVRSPMAKLLLEYRPDIIHLEQPFPFIGLEPLLKELSIHPILVFGSQNIEYVMKERIYKELELPRDRWDFIIEQTKVLEYHLSKVADLVVTVNEGDTRAHKQMGARRCVIAPNGISPSHASAAAIRYWRTFKEEKSITAVATFVGSGHPPNWLGFLRMVGSDTTFMPKGSKIIIAGGVAEYFNTEFKDKKKHADFWAGVEVVGRLEEDILAGLLHTSDVMLLPIGNKEGSNLKTAEALLADKKIVANGYAFRGFEAYEGLPNIYIATEKKDFRSAIVRTLQAEYVPRTRRHKKLVARIEWQNSLRPMLSALKVLLAHIYLKGKRDSFRETAARKKHRAKSVIKKIVRR